MLMDIASLQWSQELRDFFHLPSGIHLPKIQASSSNFGSLASGPLKGLDILGVVGDQQAALLGQGCVSSGEAKNTYGTGCFMLYNTGKEPVTSTHGLLTTVAYQVEGESASYALEGSVAVAGLALRWLRDNLGMIEDYAQAYELASQVERTGGTFCAPLEVGRKGNIVWHDSTYNETTYQQSCFGGRLFPGC